MKIAYNAHDCTFVKRRVQAGDKHGIRPADRDSKAAQEILLAHGEALQDMIATLPALTIQDAAVQVAVFMDKASRLTGFGLPPEVGILMADNIERMARGILPLIAAAAGLDMEAMNWRDEDQLRVMRFAGVRVTS